MHNLISYIPDFLNGLFITISLMIVALSMGFSLALGFCLINAMQIAILKRLVASLIFFIRGTPLLIQIFLIYYGAGQFDWLRHTMLWPLLKEPMFCAAFALGLNSACYTTILFQGAIDSLPVNMVEASYALGMSNFLIFRKVLFPLGFRASLPAYSNEAILILKGTSLASTITILDLMGITQQIINRTYATMELYIIAGCIYLMLNVLLLILFELFKYKLRIV